jgi:hypothetical protein
MTICLDVANAANFLPRRGIGNVPTNINSHDMLAKDLKNKEFEAQPLSLYFRQIKTA